MGPNPNDAQLRVISQEELDKHNKRGDLWIVIHGYVFDVSQWMESHPGGYEILADYAKKRADAGQEFEDTKHSTEARGLTTQYLIGKVASASKPFPMEGPAFKEDPKQAAGDPSMPILIGGALFVIAAVAYVFMQQKPQQKKV